MEFNKVSDKVIYLFDNDAKYKIGKERITDKMFFLGIQDIEDSLCNDIWINIIDSLRIDKLILTTEELELLRSKIPLDRAGLKHEKFYTLLQKKLKENYHTATSEQIVLPFLPYKGSDSAELIIKFITTKELIPAKIKEAFDFLILNAQ